MLDASQQINNSQRMQTKELSLPAAEMNASTLAERAKPLVGKGVDQENGPQIEKFSAGVDKAAQQAEKKAIAKQSHVKVTNDPNAMQDPKTRAEVENALEFANNLAKDYPNSPELQELAKKIQSAAGNLDGYELKVVHNKKLDGTSGKYYVLTPKDGSTKIGIAEDSRRVKSECEGSNAAACLSVKKDTIVIPTPDAVNTDYSMRRQVSSMMQGTGKTQQEAAQDFAAASYIHELAHANGKAEYGAHRAEYDFLEKQGYDRVTDEQIMDKICSNYTPMDACAAFMEMKEMQGKPASAAEVKRFAIQHGYMNKEEAQLLPPNPKHVLQAVARRSIVKQYGQGERDMQAATKKAVKEAMEYKPVINKARAEPGIDMVEARHELDKGNASYVLKNATKEQVIELVKSGDITPIEIADAYNKPDLADRKEAGKMHNNAMAAVEEMEKKGIVNKPDQMRKQMKAIKRRFNKKFDAAEQAQREMNSK